MATVYPLCAYRPRPELAAEVASVPYDVVSRDEAVALAAGHKHSFLHVTKPEIDLPSSTDPYSDAVYARGRQSLDELIATGVLMHDAEPRFYVYELTMGQHRQTGIVLNASCAEYERNIVRKHEHTRPDKESDRVRHIEVTNAQTGVVFLVHRDHTGLAGPEARARAHAPIADFIAPDGVGHRLWLVQTPADNAVIQRAFAEMGPVYIADGHHRSAAAARVAAKHRRGTINPSSPYERFLCVSFPMSQVQILPYNRVVRDLNGRTRETFFAELGQKFEVRPGKPHRSEHGQLAMFLGDAWFTLRPRAGTFDARDPVARLDVSILQDQLLAPVLGIQDPRTDQRIDFVGGIRGEAELEKRVHQGWAVAFSLHATSVDDLVAIADAEKVMPPKSTWFEPKLRDGLIVNRYTH